MRAIRETTKDGEELVTFMVRVMRGKIPGVRVRDRLEAATWLADRDFGKPAAASEPQPDVAALIAALHERHSDGPTKVYDC